MGMADEARKAQAAARSVAAANEESAAARKRTQAAWSAAVNSCVSEFLSAARELGVKPSRTRPWRKTWIVSVPTGTKNWTTEYDSGPTMQTVAVHSDGTWDLVHAFHPGTSKKLVIERQNHPVAVDVDDPAPIERIRTSFVGALTQA